MSAFRTLQPAVRPWADALLQVATQFKLRPRVSSTTRSFKKQEQLYQRFLRGESRFPAARPGRSLHNFGHAFDLHVKDEASQEWLGRVWESWGGRWGGRFNDPIHFDTGATIP